MGEITTLGIDLAKNVMQLHGVDGRGVTVLRRQLRRAQLPRVLAQLPACTVAMEACAGAPEWGRRSQAFGHQVRLIAPQFVKPFVKGNKTDRNDAEAICEAAQRPDAICGAQVGRAAEGVDAPSPARRVGESAHGAGESDARLAEGVWDCGGGGDRQLARGVPEILEDGANRAGAGRDELARQLPHLLELDDEVRRLGGRIEAWPDRRRVQGVMHRPRRRRADGDRVRGEIGEANALRTGGKWRPGWGWSRGNAPPAATYCSVSASAATLSAHPDDSWCAGGGAGRAARPGPGQPMDPATQSPPRRAEDDRRGGQQNGSANVGRAGLRLRRPGNSPTTDCEADVHVMAERINSAFREPARAYGWSRAALSDEVGARDFPLRPERRRRSTQGRIHGCNPLRSPPSQSLATGGAGPYKRPSLALPGTLRSVWQQRHGTFLPHSLRNTGALVTRTGSFPGSALAGAAMSMAPLPSPAPTLSQPDVDPGRSCEFNSFKEAEDNPQALWNCFDVAFRGASD